MRVNESRVQMLLDGRDRKLLRISKGTDADSHSCYIMMDGCHVLIKTKDVISYVYHNKDERECLRKFYYLAGKMLHKSVTSKYFKNPLEYENCRNGHPDGIHRSVWEDVAKGFFMYYPKTEEEKKHEC